MRGVGERVYALGAIALGAVQLAYGRFSADWLPVPAGLPGYHLVAEACGLVLIVAGAALWFWRTAAAGALGLAGLFIAAMLALHLPPALARPMVWGVWQAVAESTAMGAGSVLAWALARPPDEARARRAARGARLVFGLCLVVFGISHFVYAGFTASLVPVWLAPSPMFWTYATGIAQIAAGLAFPVGGAGAAGGDIADGDVSDLRSARAPAFGRRQAEPRQLDGKRRQPASGRRGLVHGRSLVAQVCGPGGLAGLILALIRRSHGGRTMPVHPCGGLAPCSRPCPLTSRPRRPIPPRPSAAIAPIAKRCGRRRGRTMPKDGRRRMCACAMISGCRRCAPGRGTRAGGAPTWRMRSPCVPPAANPTRLCL